MHDDGEFKDIMRTRTRKKSGFNKADLALVQAAIRLAGVDLHLLAIKSGKDFLNIDDTIEIHPLSLLGTRCWIVRLPAGTAFPGPCSCGATHRGEIGTYTNKSEAVAAAIAEVIRLKLLADLQRGTGWRENEGNPFHPEFNKEPVHN